MSLLQTLSEALRSLAANRLRTALTMLGIVIGIASVVLMLGVGDAVRAFIDRELSVLGSNQLIVQRGAPMKGGPPRPRANPDATMLTIDDAAAINQLPGVRAAAPTLQGVFTVLYGDDHTQSLVLGVTPEMFRVRNWVVDQGVGFSDEDVRSANRVIVIGAKVAEAHYLKRDPLGQVLRVGGRPFTVIGVLAGSGRTLDGTDLGELLVVPITALPLTMPRPRSVHYINVQAVSEARLHEVEVEVAELLRDRRRITGDTPDDFNITNLASIAQTGANIAAALAIGLGVIGAVSLLVGGIGIMNIMLVSVSERVREIGIRMAIGAKPRHVLTQFLAEAVVMCLLGGLVGVGLAALGVWGVNHAAVAGLKMQLSATHVGVAVLFSTGVGLFFGFYPARRASRLLPIECLRQE
ncbi:MAG: ABC transporter permease [Rubrivivax sp.]|nr:ABC transporter permease [Rubrivivax sp.]